MLSREEKQKIFQLRLSLSWTCHNQRPWVGSFLLSNVAQWNSRHPSEKSITGLDHEFSRQPWILKSDMLWPFAKALAAGIWDSDTLLFFFSPHFFCKSFHRAQLLQGNRDPPVCQLRCATNQGICSLETFSQRHCLHVSLTPQSQSVLFPKGLGQIHHVGFK